jgi:hypothetical protein
VLSGANHHAVATLYDSVQLDASPNASGHLHLTSLQDMEIRIQGHESPTVLRMTAAFLMDLAALNEQVPSPGLVTPAAQATVADKKRSQPTAPKGGVEAAVAGVKASKVEAPAVVTPLVFDDELSEEAAARSAAAAAASSNPGTLEDARKALQSYSQKTSMDDAIQLLKKFGAQRISDLNDENRANFIAECEKA